MISETFDMLIMMMHKYDNRLYESMDTYDRRNWMREKRKENYFIVPVYSIVHFIVDFACAYLMYRSVIGSGNWEISFLLYNFCAFALQMPIGLLADRWNRNALCAIAGCGLVAAAYGLVLMNTVLAVLIAGIGNALFHVGGGIEMLNRSKGKAGILGVFVSPGAAGIYLGTLLGKQLHSASYAALLLLAASVLLLFYIEQRGGRRFRSENPPLDFPKAEWNTFLLPIGCFLFVVCLRSYLGMTANYPWKSIGGWGIAFLAAVVLGKMLGGFLADWLGVKKAVALSLGVAAISYLLSYIPWCGIIAVFCFQMTMPITLWAMGKLLHQSRGFAFGILTFGLFLGNVPVFFGYNQLLSRSVGFAGAAFLSLLLLLWGLRKMEAGWERT
jgi:FSR family fosmidomycin resistance protein-like MFS transporter